MCNSKRPKRLRQWRSAREQQVTLKCTKTDTDPFGRLLKTAVTLLQHLNMAPPSPLRRALQPLFSEEKIYTMDEIPNSDKLFQNGLCLPSGTNLSGEDQKKIINKMLATLAKGN